MFKSQRLMLLPMERHMASKVLEWLLDEDVAQWAVFGDPRPLTVEEIEEQIVAARADPRIRMFAIVPLDSISPIGEAILQGIDWKNRSAQYGLIIGDRQMRGRGIGQEVTRIIVEYAFSDLGLHRIEALVLSGNVAAIHCLEKVGFTREGVKKEAVWENGQWYDVMLLGITAPSSLLSAK